MKEVLFRSDLISFLIFATKPLGFSFIICSHSMNLKGTLHRDHILPQNGMYQTNPYLHFICKFLDGDMTSLYDQNSHWSRTSSCWLVEGLLKHGLLFTICDSLWHACTSFFNSWHRCRKPVEFVSIGYCPALGKMWCVIMVKAVLSICGNCKICTWKSFMTLC